MHKKILIMAGGTGGHVFPGLAVAKLLANRGWDIHWLGTAARMEAQLVPKHGFDISFIDVAGVRGNGIVRKLKAPLQIIKSIFQARRVIKSFKPNVVLGLGGFASGPGGVAAWLSRIPLVLHEQNAIPGMTNKILSRLARRVLTGFDRTFEQQKNEHDKYQWVGNPVRVEFADAQHRDTVHSPIRLLVVGGSLGAKVLNEHIPAVLNEVPNLEVRHQCGAGHLEAVNASYQAVDNDGISWQVDEFIDDMAAAYQWADLVVCRAGALTVAEIAAVGVASIFVPLPYAVDDHQTVNAQALETLGAAILLPQKTLVEGGLKPVLMKILSAPQELINMGRKAQQFARLDATLTVANVCNDLAEGSR